MTGRTHDLAAFTSLNLVLLSQPLHQYSLATVLVSLSANFVGGLTPDIDQPTANLWHRLPAGTLLGKIISPLLGGHRFVSHSIVGAALFGFLSRFLLNLASGVLLVDMNTVWWAFMIGYVSHLIMDTFTKEGVFWLFPIPIRIGLPPIRDLRMKTGGAVEKYFVFPGLILFNGYLFYNSYSKVIDFLRHYVR